MGVEAVGGPPPEAPVARNEKGRPVMAPGSPGTKQIGITTGRIRDRWSWRNPHPRDDADEDWGPEEEAEYEDTEEDV